MNYAKYEYQWPVLAAVKFLWPLQRTQTLAARAEAECGHVRPRLSMSAGRYSLDVRWQECLSCQAAPVDSQWGDVSSFVCVPRREGDWSMSYVEETRHCQTQVSTRPDSPVFPDGLHSHYWWTVQTNNTRLNIIQVTTDKSKTGHIKFSVLSKWTISYLIN